MLLFVQICASDSLFHCSSSLYTSFLQLCESVCGPSMVLLTLLWSPDANLDAERRVIAKLARMNLIRKFSPRKQGSRPLSLELNWELLLTVQQLQRTGTIMFEYYHKQPFRASRCPVCTRSCYPWKTQKIKIGTHSFWQANTSLPRPDRRLVPCWSMPLSGAWPCMYKEIKTFDLQSHDRHNCCKHNVEQDLALSGVSSWEAKQPLH